MSGYHAKKRLGQNFLISQSIIDRIVGLVVPGPGRPVIEIGPGRGALTVPLAKSGAEIWAVEFDRDLVGYLSKLLASHLNARVINADFLGFEPDPNQLPQFCLVGNLPFNITSPVIDWCVRYHKRITTAVLMVQDELAARLAGSPGSKDWSPLSIFTQLHFEVQRRFTVPPSSFQPAPKVTSAVITLAPRTSVVHLPEGFETVVRTAFKHRRKQLVNNLVPGLVPDAAAARDLMAEVSLDPTTRAEQVTIEQFLELTRRLNSRKLV
jgi:16S rRNA (adenine1518-N6/adenine1519-N6)-dimethyltransferase